MLRTPILALFASLALLLTAHAAKTHDLAGKYAGVIGKQYRTKADGYIRKMPRHQFEFVPYHLDTSIGGTEPALAHIPAGTVVTVKAAKRSYVGGDWDYLIAEVRAPENGQVYEFEEMLGFSTFFPGNMARRWDPVDKDHTPAPLPNKGKLISAPHARFSIDQEAFPRRAVMHTVTESQNPGSLSFTLQDKRLVRIDYCTAPQTHLPNWAAKSTATNPLDRTLEGVAAFVGAKTPGLREFKLITRRSSADLGGETSAAVYHLNLTRGEYAGPSYRGFLIFAHGTDSFVLHYQTGETFPDDQAAGEAVLAQLLKLRDAMLFHPPE